MKYKGTLIAVLNIEKSKRWYREVLGLSVKDDFGSNVVLEDGVILQTADTWNHFIGGAKMHEPDNASELYFEEDNIDAFYGKLVSFDIRFAHGLIEHSWGQRAVRFFDPDGHIIEVGESLSSVVGRFTCSGMTVSETAARMDVPEEYVLSLMNRH